MLLDEFKPDLLLYDAGVDVHISDNLGLMCMSDAGIYTRDYIVLSEAVKRRIPVACVIGGGYQTHMHKLVKAHGIVFKAANDVWNKYMSEMTM